MCAWNNKVKRGSIFELQQLLKLLEYDHNVSRYKVYVDIVSVWDIFWTNSDSIELFNRFPIVLIIDSTYKTNKHRLPLLGIVGVTFTEMTFSIGFAFLESEKGQCYTSFENMQDYVERPRKHAASNSHRPTYRTDEFGCNGVSYIVSIT